ncbi:hypothetical protein HPP92_019603 [Vanilla planifolia]|uniref:Uncharacterized protein n=1 Tax=Vanilla planifolia TaxID=51239 RepID=A0A835UJQ5_VANPL|nr:hypothetical protein HPP92_020027 [Vanilla planifolia]KAG0465439.1 hypothetical protein HPP92_019603 [Vanilla planifolia]
MASMNAARCEVRCEFPVEGWSRRGAMGAWGRRRTTGGWLPFAVGLVAVP